MDENSLAINEKILELKRGILDWSKKNIRDFAWRHESDPYIIFITEKLLQQTDYGHVRKVYPLFFQKFPSLFDLSKATQEEIAQILKPLGLWRQRSKQLKEISEIIISKHNGNVPNTYEQLRDLPGIGDYVARSTLCFAFKNPTHILDVNTRKVILRYFFYPENVKDKQVIQILEILTPKEPEECKIFNWGLIDFSGTICSRKPKCKICFLTEKCSFYAAINAK